MSKKLINNPVDVVDEALAGLVASCPGVTLLKGHRVIVRADVEEITKQGKVNVSLKSGPAKMAVANKHL